MGFIVYFIPAVITALLWERLFYGDSYKKGRLVIEYLISLLGINLIDFIVVSYISNSSGNVFEKIINDSDFAVRYIMLSIAVAVIIPFVCKFFASRFTTTVHCGKLTKKVPWRLFAIAYTLALFFLNFIRIFDNNFWGDEAYTIGLAKMSIGEMCKTTAADVHPPLFYIFEIIGYRLFGWQGWVFHGVALVPYALMLIFFLTVVWKNFGKIPAVLMITFSSILGSSVIYNVEVRMYSWAALFVMLAFYGFYLVLKNGKWTSYLIFILSSLAAAYTHYYAMMTVSFFYIALLFYAFTKKIKWRNVIASYAVVIAGYLPWIFHMFNTFRRTSEDFWMTGVPTFNESLLFYFGTSEETAWYSSFMFWITVVMFIIGILYSVRVISFRKKGNKTEISFGVSENDLSVMDRWLIWGIIAAVGTLVVGELISILIRPMFIQRYIYPAAVIFWMVFSVSLSRMKSRKILGIIFTVLTLCVCVPQYLNTYKVDKEIDIKCRTTAEYVQAAVGKNDCILSDIGWFAVTVIPCYLPEVNYSYVSGGDYTNFKSGTQYWLMWGNDLGDTETAWLSAHGYQAEETYHDGVLGSWGVHIYKLKQGE